MADIVQNSFESGAKHVSLSIVEEGDRLAVEAGKTDAHIRLNLATSRANVELAVTRLIDAIGKR